jgi:hypothetical protein
MRPDSSISHTIGAQIAVRDSTLTQTSVDLKEGHSVSPKANERLDGEG